MDEIDRLTAQIGEYQTSNQPEKAVETIRQVIELETTTLRKGGWHTLAGMICRTELKRPAEALEHFETALDCYWSDEPAETTLIEAKATFDSIGRILTATSDWKTLDRAYRKMIFRMKSYRRFDKLRAELFVELGNLYQTELGMADAALNCFAEARTLDPTLSV